MIIPTQNHAEAGILSELDVTITKADIDPNVEGTVTIIQSKATGVCPACKSGLGNPEATDGVMFTDGFQEFNMGYLSFTHHFTGGSNTGSLRCLEDNIVIW